MLGLVDFQACCNAPLSAFKSHEIEEAHKYSLSDSAYLNSNQLMYIQATSVLSLHILLQVESRADSGSSTMAPFAQGEFVGKPDNVESFGIESLFLLFLCRAKMVKFVS